jgi:hypothetical protein
MPKNYLERKARSRHTLSFIAVIDLCQGQQVSFEGIFVLPFQGSNVISQRTQDSRPAMLCVALSGLMQKLLFSMLQSLDKISGRPFALFFKTTLALKGRTHSSTQDISYALSV